MKKLNFLLFAVLAIIIGSMSVSAATFTGLINLTGSNTTVNVTNIWTYTSLRVDDTSFYITNFTQNQAPSIDTLTFNFTGQTNKRYIGTDLPYYTASSNSQKIVASNIPGNINSTAYLYVETCAIKNITYTSHTGNQTILASPTCSGLIATFPNAILDYGSNNQFFIEYNPIFNANTCYNGLQGFVSVANMLPLIVTALIIVTVLGIVLFFAFGKGSSSDMGDMVESNTAGMVALVVGISAVVIITIFILYFAVKTSNVIC